MQVLRLLNFFVESMSFQDSILGTLAKFWVQWGEISKAHPPYPVFSKQQMSTDFSETPDPTSKQSVPPDSPISVQKEVFTSLQNELAKLFSGNLKL